MRQQITQRVDHAELLVGLQRLWEQDFVPTSIKVAELLPEGGDTRIVPSWSAILAALPDVVGDITVRTINGTAKDALDYSENAITGLKVIAIGGDKLARG
ncbi:MAG: Z1 domain-containing protein, partial [Rhodanobacter sp.]